MRTEHRSFIRAAGPLSAIAIICVALVLSACRGQGGGSASPSQVNLATASASQSSLPIETVNPSASPSDSLGAFSCEFPRTGKATVQRAHLVNVRVGTHAGYDRVVFEFETGLPAFTLERATPPLLEDASGRQMDVDGNAFWQLVMHDASRTDPDGMTSFTNTDRHPGFPKLAALVEGGDFEAVSTWYFGLEAESCARILTLANPSRLVIDIEH